MKRFLFLAAACTLLLATSGWSQSLNRNTKFIHVADLASLTTLTPTDGEYLFVRGATTSGDQGVGFYRYDADSTLTANADNVVADGDGGAGRFIKVAMNGLVTNPIAAVDLTDGVATEFVQVAVASESSVAGVIHYSVQADDGTDFQRRTGSVNFSIVNKAGTESAVLGTVVNEAFAESAGASTLSATIAADTAPTNGVNFTCNAASSLTETTLAIDYWVELFTPTTVTPQ